MTNAVITAQQGSSSGDIGFKNRIINGAFEIWQRGTAQIFVTAGAYLADRWTCMGYQQARHQRVAVSSPVAGMFTRYAMRVSSSPNSDNGSGGTRMDLSQKIENANCFDLAGQQVVYSYWIRFSSATVASVANLQNSAFGNFNSVLASSTTNTDAATSTDSIGSVNGSVVINNGSLPTTWTFVTGTATIPAGANNVALRLQFQQLGSTTNAGDVWYEVTQIQLEAGSAPTAFDFRDYGRELALCERYYTKSYRLATFPGTATRTGAIGYVCANGGNGEQSRVFFPTSMRIAPGVTFYNPATGTVNQVRNYTTNADTGVSINEISERGITGGTGTPVDGQLFFYHYTADAEI